jgi:hypothetical protein
MTQSQKPARDVAESMPKPAIGASEAYLKARTDLLKEEIELRRHMERVAEQRRALPPGPVVKEDSRKIMSLTASARTASQVRFDCRICSATAAARS